MKDKKNSLSKALKNSIFNLMPDRAYIFMMYKRRTGKFPNLRHPQGFNEKLQWLKLNYRDPKYKIYSDKYLVRDYVSKTVGGQYLNELYGVYHDPDEIDWDSLPNSFVLRCSHGSGFNILCTGKSKLNREECIEQLKKWIQIDYSRHAREWVYKNNTPAILCEKFLQSNIIDYKFYCFNGRPRFFYLSFGDDISGECEAITFLNLDWSPAPFRRIDHDTMDVPFGRPDNFDEMISIAEKLSRDIPFVRVDLFNVDGKIYFSEMTFFPGGGFTPFYPDKYEYETGRFLELPRERI